MAIQLTDSTTDKIDWGDINGGSDLDPVTYAVWMKFATWTLGRKFIGTEGGTDKFQVEASGSAGTMLAVAQTDASVYALPTTLSGVDTSGYLFLAFTLSSASGGGGDLLECFAGDIDTAVASMGSTSGGSGSHLSGGGNTRLGDVDASDGSVTADFAWVGVWDRVLTLGELQAQQWTPHVTPGCRLCSWMYSTSAVTDWSGLGHTASLTGAANSADQVPLAPSFGRRWERWGSGHFVPAPADTNISPGVAQLVLSSVAPDVDLPIGISPPVADLVLSPTAPTKTQDHVRVGAAGDLVLDTTAPLRDRDHIRSAAAGDLTLSPTAPTRDHAHTRAGAAGDLTLDGTAPTVDVAGPGAINITPPAADLTLSAVAPARVRTTTITPTTGDLVLSTVAPTVGGDLVISPSAGDLVLSSAVPSRVRTTTIGPTTGDLVLSPVAPERVHDHGRSGSSGDLVLTATAPAKVRTVSIAPATAQLTLSSTASTVLVGVLIPFTAWDVPYQNRAWNVPV